MALSVRRWIAAALVGCAGLAVALLPPEIEPPAQLARQFDRDVSPTAQIGRAARRDQQALLYLERRDDALRLLRAARVARPTAAFLVDPRVRNPRGRDGLPPRLRAFAAAFDSSARALAPLDSGVQLVLLATQSAQRSAPGVGGSVTLRGVSYLLPPITDGRVCLLIVAVDVRLAPPPDILGPCAFYGAFGLPGAGVAQWLRATAHYGAGASDWATVRPPHTLDVTDMLRFMSLGDIWTAVGYSGLTMDGAACASGRLSRCRTLVDAGPYALWAHPTLRAGPLAEVSTRLWLDDEQQWFLADLVRTMGRERFARFWRSPLPRDSAFQATFGMPMEEWTHRWIHARRPAVRIGSAIRASSALVSLAIAMLLLGGGAYYTTRRQIA